MRSAVAELHREQERAVRDELSAELARPIDWPVRIMLGTPSTAIAQEAASRRRRADHPGIAAPRSAGSRGARRDGAQRHARRRRARVRRRRRSCTSSRAASSPPSTSARAASPRCAPAARGGEKVPSSCSHTSIRSNGFLADEGEETIHDLGVQAGFVKLSGELGRADVEFDHLVLHTAPRAEPARRRCWSTPTRSGAI
jgi:hypothetical protein